MFTTIIKVKAFGPLSFVVASVAIAMAVDVAYAQEAKPKTVCEGLGGYAQEFANMRDLGFDMIDALNYFIAREQVVDDIALEWAYTLATIAYENSNQTAEDVGYVTFLACMDSIGG